MAVAANSFEAETSVEGNISFRVLEQRVEHIQSDLADMKTDMRRLEAKIESTRDTVSDIKDSVAALRVETKDSVATLRAETKDGLAALRTETKDSIAALRTETKDSIAALRTETKDSIAALRAETKDSLAELRTEIKDGFAASNQKHTELAAAICVLDAKYERLDKKFDDKLGGEDLMVRVNALFDRKFFRATSVFVGAVPPIVVLASMAEKASLGTYALLAIAIAVPAVLITGAFLVTRSAR